MADRYITSTDRAGNEAVAYDHCKKVELFQVFEDVFEGDDWWEVVEYNMWPEMCGDWSESDATVFEDFSDAASYFYDRVDAFDLTTNWEVTKKGGEYVW